MARFSHLRPAPFARPWPELDPATPVIARDLAERWQKSPRTLQRWRAQGYGPAWLKIGSTVYYRVGDILAFEARQCGNLGRAT